MTKLALAQTDTPDPVRAALAEAITRHKVAQQRVTVANAEAEGLWSRKADARAAVESAEAALMLAQDLLSNPQAEASGGNLINVHAARELLQDAQDTMAAVERSKTRIEDSAKAAESALGLAEMAVKSAIAQVAMPSTRKLDASKNSPIRRLSDSL